MSAASTPLLEAKETCIRTHILNGMLELQDILGGQHTLAAGIRCSGIQSRSVRARLSRFNTVATALKHITFKSVDRLIRDVKQEIESLEGGRKSTDISAGYLAGDEIDEELGSGDDSTTSVGDGSIEDVVTSGVTSKANLAGDTDKQDDVTGSVGFTASGGRSGASAEMHTPYGGAAPCCGPAQFIPSRWRKSSSHVDGSNIGMSTERWLSNQESVTPSTGQSQVGYRDRDPGKKSRSFNGPCVVCRKWTCSHRTP